MSSTPSNGVSSVSCSGPDKGGTSLLNEQYEESLDVWPIDGKVELGLIGLEWTVGG